MGAIARSWTITKLSLKILSCDKELLLFPILGGIFSILYLLVLLFPFTFLATVLKFLDRSNQETLEWIVVFLGIFIVYLGIVFFATFFSVCTIYTAKVRLEGGNAGFFESLRFALTKLNNIFRWSLISATIGLILTIIDTLAKKAEDSDNTLVSILGFVGKIIASLVGFSWSLVSAFVLPMMVYRDVRPMESLKKSTELLMKTWGENLTRELGGGLITGIALVIGIAIFSGLAFLVQGFGHGFMIAVIALGAVYIIAFIVISSLLGLIFNTALFVYADQGVIPFGFDQETMKAAFRTKKKE